MSTPVLEVRGVTKAYGETPVLRGIDLSVGAHEAVALIGASGSGKSTLLRCIDLLEEIDDGDVLLDGEVVTDPSVDPVAVRRRARACRRSTTRASGIVTHRYSRAAASSGV